MCIHIYIYIYLYTHIILHDSSLIRGAPFRPARQLSPVTLEVRGPTKLHIYVYVYVYVYIYIYT